MTLTISDKESNNNSLSLTPAQLFNSIVIDGLVYSAPSWASEKGDQPKARPPNGSGELDQGVFELDLHWGGGGVDFFDLKQRYA